MGLLLRFQERAGGEIGLCEAAKANLVCKRVRTAEKSCYSGNKERLDKSYKVSTISTQFL
jgi:hypothetical protein